jgi:hypothetical protein
MSHAGLSTYQQATARDARKLMLDGVDGVRLERLGAHAVTRDVAGGWGRETSAGGLQSPRECC